MSQEHASSDIPGDSSPAKAQERVLPLRLDAETDQRLRTLAAVIGFSEGATAKIALRFAAEHLMMVVRRTMEEVARDYIVRALGLPPNEETRRATPITDIQLDDIVERARNVQFDIYQAKDLLERRRYLKNPDRLRYQGDASERVTASLLFEPRSAAGLRDALRDARNEAATILLREVTRFRHQWLNVGGLRHQLLELERQHSLATPEFVRELQAQAQALSEVVTGIERDGHVTERTLHAVRTQPFHPDWVLPTLQRTDLDDAQKLNLLKQELAVMMPRVDGLVRLRDQHEQWLENLQRSPAWNDAEALAEMVQQRQAKTT